MKKNKCLFVSHVETIKMEKIYKKYKIARGTEIEIMHNEWVLIAKFICTQCNLMVP